MSVRAAGALASFDPRPWHWAGDAAASAVSSGWKSLMIGLWSAGLWLLRFAFQVVDTLTTPDLSSSGPLGAILPLTLWIGATMAVLMALVQVGAAAARLDGKALGRVAIGLVQFGGVWVGYLGVASGLVLAASGLTKGILQSGLGVDSFAGADVTKSWPRQLTDDALVTVLGVLSVFLILAAIMYLVVMLVRMAALIILAATAPISAAGLLSDVGKAWFWKTTRWFLSCVLMSPVAALVLVVGVKVAAGVTAGMGTSTTSAIGTAVVAVMIILVGAFSPLAIFKLLAFVDPGTASGAALRQNWSDAGGLSGVMGNGTNTGSGTAAQPAADGGSQGEQAAATATASRFGGAFGSVFGATGQAFAGGVGAAAGAAYRGVDIATDVLSQAGVGAPGYSLTPTDTRSGRGNRQGGGSGPTLRPPSPAQPGAASPGAGAGLPGAAGEGAGGAAGGGAEAAAVVAL